MLKWLFRQDPAKIAGQALYAACAKNARNSAFYLELGVPDSVEGRFELYALHVILVIERLKGQGDQAGAVSQALFDALLRGLDDGLRDMGVGDLSVGKKMRKLGEALYGRARNLDEALAMLPDPGPLRAFLKRTVYETVPDGPVDALADWVVLANAALGQATLDSVMSGAVDFPAVTIREPAA